MESCISTMKNLMDHIVTIGNNISERELILYFHEV